MAELFPAMLGAVMNESIFIQYKSIVSSHVTDAGSKANGDIPCGYQLTSRCSPNVAHDLSTFIYTNLRAANKAHL